MCTFLRHSTKMMTEGASHHSRKWDAMKFAKENTTRLEDGNGAADNLTVPVQQ